MEPAALVQRQRAFFQSGATRPLVFRRAQLQKLAAALETHEAALLAALKADLGKSRYQSLGSELALVQAELRHALKSLNRWARPKRCRTPWFTAPSKGWAQPEPYGVALILGPWNYPVQLLFAPLVSAIAAGNCAVLKPSELAAHTSSAVAELIRATFNPEYISVVTGGPQVAEALLAEHFDKIFFTGSTRVGRIVMTAAARHLTPVTLELGGKCPSILCSDCDVELAAKRIAWGKFLNAGQTCVAPDFVLLPRGMRDAFVSALGKWVDTFYGADAAKSSDYGRIINDGHFSRLVRYLDEGKAVIGGASDRSTRFIAPMVFVDVRPGAAVMEEEIFGPILPVLEYGSLDEALTMLRSRPTPLALYVFTHDRACERRILTDVRSGGVCVNDVVSHMVGTGLPFGGLGESGMGAYRGQTGFEAFSHSRSVLRRATWLDTPFRYPPERLSLAGLKRALRILLG